MAKDSGLDWQAQLSQLRGTVEKMEEQRAEERRLQLERSRESLVKRLRKDTPQRLTEQLQELRKECDKAARRFFPPEAIDEALGKLSDFRKKLMFYKDCRKDFPDLFPPQLTEVIDRRLAELDKSRQGLERQVKQWASIGEILQDASFRPKTDEDNRALSESAKEFSQRAHSMGLSIPADFFGGESENFWAVELAGDVIGYIKYWTDKDVVTFALAPRVEVNFPKFVRGVLYKAYKGPLADKKAERARVRLTMNKEVKFFTDLGFSRSETVSVSEWIFDRPLD